MSAATSDDETEVVQRPDEESTAVLLSYPCQRRPELFFDIRGRTLELAKELCATCPVRHDCLSAALDRGEPHGVWGGEILVDGVVVPTKRGPGRPRRAA
jgi:WhiB family redox-sensing transcriptional regulator